MKPPRMKKLSRDDMKDAPSWIDPLLAVLNEALSGLVNALDHNLTRADNFNASERKAMEFNTSATVSSTWPLRIKPQMNGRPSHLIVTNLVRIDGGAHAGPWSWSWNMNDQGEIELAFQGLSASTAYKASLVYE